MTKTIVITGAGDGLGRAMARRFARDGDTVVLLGRTFAKVQAVADELGPTHLPVECDVADPASVRTAFGRVAERFPRVDVLVNNAGLFEPFTLAEVRDEQIFDQLHTNLAGPILCAREALPLLRGGGHIVNITSESVQLKMPMLWLYAGSKTALELVSDMWSRELETDGVRVTVVRAGQMMDETKTPPKWPLDVSMRFLQTNAAAGLNIRERPLSHYNSVADAMRAIVDTPPDLHIGLATFSARRV